MGTEEFNKYLSYVRNLGFEDTPDYDFLRDLFTQATRNAHELEDGEYDWMKLNGGRGWEMKSPVSNLHHGLNPPAEASNRALVGTSGVRGADGRPSNMESRGAISPDRLNAAQPPTPGSHPLSPNAGSGAKRMQAGIAKSPRERGNVSGAGAKHLPKRSSALTGQMNAPTTPSDSMQPQVKNSNLDVTSTARQQGQVNGGLHSEQGTPVNGQRPEPQPSFIKKLMRALCCTGSR